MSNAQTTTVANEILNQLGGNKFIAMTGAHSFGAYSDENGSYLQMKLRRNKSKAQTLRITLTANDLYTIEFFQLTKDYDVKTVYKLENAYNDMLRRVFTQVTGMDTSL